MEEEWEVAYREMAKSYGWSDERINKDIKTAKENRKKKSTQKLIDSDYYDYKLDVGNITVTIEYLPGNDGEPFMRTVDIQAVLSRNSSLYFGGFCHLRNDENVFSIESVGAAFIDNKPVYFRGFIKDLIKDDAFLSSAFSERYGGLHGINICVTGISPKKRTQIRDKIRELGGRFHYEVDFNTHFLVRGTALRNMNKYQLARANNIPVITEAQLSGYFENPEKAQMDKIGPKRKDDFCMPQPVAQPPAKSAAELAGEALNP